MATTGSALSRTFIQLADSLVGRFDVIELLTMLAHSCVELFDASGVGILLGDQRGTLQIVASSSEQARLLELFQLQNDEGPCLECFSTGEPVMSLDLAAIDRWPLFGQVAQAVGYGSVLAVPLRRDGTVIGTLNMFMKNSVMLDIEDLDLCQALADVATVSISQSDTANEPSPLHTGLQHALESRLAIEQAKGILAERLHVTVTDAFSELRQYAHDTDGQLSEVARTVVTGELTLTRLALSNSAERWREVIHQKTEAANRGVPYGSRG